MLVTDTGRVGGNMCIPRTSLAVPVDIGIVVHFITVDVVDTKTSRVTTASCSHDSALLQGPPLPFFSELLHLVTLMRCEVWAHSDAVAGHFLPGVVILHHSHGVLLSLKTHDHRPGAPVVFTNMHALYCRM